ncbi:MAG: ergothioneine biosynthesis protein EgtB [Planctomycetota bacterium]
MELNARTSASESPASPAALMDRYTDVRGWTHRLAEPLSAEDMQVQSMPDASPAKWHLAHTAWFFERFILRDQLGHDAIDDRYEFIFNSYYNAVGPQHSRPKRGLLSRPSVAEIFEYRATVDARMHDVLSGSVSNSIAGLVEVGLNHEQQHQELLLTDIKHALGANPLKPAYLDDAAAFACPEDEQHNAGTWLSFEGGLIEIGHDATKPGFAYDCETPRHTQYVNGFEIFDRLATNAEFATFIDDGGYTRSDLWLDAGWSFVQQHQLDKPLYWNRKDDDATEFTLAGQQPLDPDLPVCHISLYEADAFARWKGCRLPTEAEWEHAAETVGAWGATMDDRVARPTLACRDGMRQAFGECWEWTGTQFRPYPGFTAQPGALGEYNSKFMSDQFVLRGGSMATPRTHLRTTYRNFFPASARWQFTGVRLCRDLA